MDSIDGDDMTTHPVTVSHIAPQTIAYPLLVVNTPPQTEGETTADGGGGGGTRTDDHGDHIYVNRHLVPICPDSGDVDLDDIPSLSDINLTPPTSPTGGENNETSSTSAAHSLYENTREIVISDVTYYENTRDHGPASSRAGDTLYENLPDEEDGEGAPKGEGYYENTGEGGQTVPALPPRFLDAAQLLDISNIEEEDDLLEDKLKPDVADIKKRLMFYLRQDIARQNIKFCYDLLDKVEFRIVHILHQ